MVKSRYWMFKAPPELKTRLDEILTERGKLGKPVKEITYKRLGLAMSRHPQLMKDLIKADLKMERKNGIKKNIFG